MWPIEIFSLPLYDSTLEEIRRSSRLSTKGNSVPHCLAFRKSLHISLDNRFACVRPLNRDGAILKNYAVQMAEEESRGREIAPKIRVRILPLVLRWIVWDRSHASSNIHVHIFETEVVR